MKSIVLVTLFAAFAAAGAAAQTPSTRAPSAAPSPNAGQTLGRAARLVCLPFIGRTDQPIATVGRAALQIGFRQRMNQRDASGVTLGYAHDTDGIALILTEGPQGSNQDCTLLHRLPRDQAEQTVIDSFWTVGRVRAWDMNDTLGPPVWMRNARFSDIILNMPAPHNSAISIRSEPSGNPAAAGMNELRFVRVYIGNPF
jgi:hypothetical protein